MHSPRYKIIRDNNIAWDAQGSQLMNRKSLTFMGLAVLWLALLGGMGIWWQMSKEVLPEPPSSSVEAYKRLQHGGFFIAGKPNSDFTVSREPITEEEGSGLFIRLPIEQWKGKARVYSYNNGSITVVWLDAPDYLKEYRWGNNMVLCGDPELVDEIIRLQPVAGESKVQKKP